MRIALLLFLALGAFSRQVSSSNVGLTRIRLGTNPGAIIKIRRSALDSFFFNIGRLTPRYAKKVSIPDMSTTVSGVDITTYDLQVANFDEPKITYALAPPNKINGSLHLPTVSIQGPFNATRRTFIKTQRDHGLLVFNAKDVRVSFQATLGEFENGVPMIETFECQSFLGPANLNVKNAHERFAIEVMAMGARTIRPLYHSQVCSTAKNLVSGQLNHLLGRMPDKLAVNRNLEVKYQVRPRVATQYIQVALYGKVLTEEVSPFEPEKFVETPNEDAMVVMLLSDAPFNDLAYQAYMNKKLEFTINKDSDPLLYGFVQLKCAPENEACLGNVAPVLAQKYGADALVEAEFKALKAPEIEFIQDKAIFKAAFAAALTITPANDTSKPYHEATATVDLNGALKVRIHSNVLYSKIDIEQVIVHIDEENQREWEEKIRKTIKGLIEEQINNNVLHKGIPLNLPFGVGVDEPLIKFAPHTLQVHSGFEFLAQTSSEEKP